MDNKSVIFHALVFFLVAFWAANPNAWGIDSTLFGRGVNTLLILALLIDLFDYKSILNPKTKSINLYIILFCALIIFSGYVNEDFAQQFDFDGIVLGENRSFTAQSWRYAILRAMGILYFFLCNERIMHYNKQNLFLKCLFLFLLFYTALMFVSVILSRNSLEASTAWGGKFLASYTFLYFIVIFCLYKLEFSGRHFYRRNVITILMLSTLFSFKTECTTGMLGSLSFLILFIFPNITNVIKKPALLLVTLIFFNTVLFFFSTWILSYPFVQDFIVDVLHEDLTLTGRIGIYSKIVEVFNESPWYGLGVGNYAGISFNLTGCANAQNGLINLFLELGIIGCFLFLIILYKLSKEADIHSTYNLYLLIFLLSEIIISAVEIPFSEVAFYSILSLFVLNKNYNEIKSPLV